MPSKQTIIDNIDQYDAREIADFIIAGDVTFDELCNEAGEFFSAGVRKEVQRLLAQNVGQGQEEADWAKAKSSESIKALEAYLKNYPKGKHRDEAKALIQKLENRRNTDPDEDDDKPDFEPMPKTGDEDEDEDEGYNTTSLKDDIEWLWKDGADEKEIYDYILSQCGDNTKAEILALMQEDPNIIPAATLRMLYENKLIKGRDLENIGIDRRFVCCMISGVNRATFIKPEKLEQIHKRPTTEVYFWGIPDSGKSTALGAILSTAYNGSVAYSMSMDNNCQGYGYMTRLSDLFKANGEVVALPEKTSTTSTYEMSFDLVDNKRRTHPITFIDLAGELMRCMYKKDANEPLTEEDRESLDALTNVLIDNRTGNRKIHFFVLEYGAENRKYDGIAQNVYISGAMKYLESTDIFKKDTDAIFLMVTKVDKIKAEGSRMKDVLRDYISKHYQGFYNSLQTLCLKNEIGDGTGRAEIIPFSLGDVCMRYYCLFDDRAAKSVVQLLIDHCKGFKGGWMGKWRKRISS